MLLPSPSLIGSEGSQGKILIKFHGQLIQQYDLFLNPVPAALLRERALSKKYFCRVCSHFNHLNY